MTDAQKMDAFTFLRDVWASNINGTWNPEQDTAFNYFLNIICPKDDPTRDQFLAEFSEFCG